VIAACIVIPIVDFGIIIPISTALYKQKHIAQIIHSFNVDWILVSFYFYERFHLFLFCGYPIL